MKKLFFTALLSLMVVGVNAQKKTLKGAKKALNKKEYVQAIELATQASTNPETQDNADVYIILGKANMYLFNEDSASLDYGQKSFDAYQIAIEKGGDKVKEELMDDPIVTPDGTWIAGGEGLMFLQTMLNKQGNVHFEAQEFEKSYDYFLISAMIVPEDIVMAFYVGYSAYGADKDEEALKYYSQVIEMDKERPEDDKFSNAQFAYNGVIDIYFARLVDYEKALEYIRAAKVNYPDEKLYKEYEIDVLIKSEKMEEAIEGLKEVAASGSATKSTHYTLAFLYWKNKDFQEALVAADAALALDPDYYDALYVAGSVYYNEAAELIKAANNTNDDAEYQDLKKKAVVKFRDAMPYFEKAIVQRPDDVYSLNPLSTIYDQLDMDAKRDVVLQKIENLEKLEEGGN